MMTQTHLIAVAALLSKKNDAPRNWAVFAGALLPDAAIFVFFGWGVASGFSQNEMWDELYWRDDWQSVFAIENSIFLFGIMALGGWMLRDRSKAAIPLMAAGAAGLLHIFLDFPVHASDAHQHFWPISEWRFHAPISYWEPGYFPHFVVWVEAIIGVGGAYMLWRRFKAIWLRIVLAIVVALYGLAIFHIVFA